MLTMRNILSLYNQLKKNLIWPRRCTGDTHWSRAHVIDQACTAVPRAWRLLEQLSQWNSCT